jgi:hypothetical protein
MSCGWSPPRDISRISLGLFVGTVVAADGYPRHPSESIEIGRRAG